MAIYGNTVGGFAPIKVIQLELEDGTVLEGVVAEEVPVIDATPKDVMLGKTAILSSGIVTGEREFLSYRTTRSSKLILPGMSFSIQLSDYDKYDYTQFQCVIAKRNTSTTDSVEVDRVGLYNNIYATNSTEVMSSITKNTNNKSIDLNITNNTEDMYYIHYFTFKEEQL